MGYVDKILGDSERVVYSSHQHLVVLLQRAIGWLLLMIVFLAWGLTVRFSSDNMNGERLRWWIGLVTLVSVVIPLYLILAAWRQGQRGADLARRIWLPALAAILILVVAGIAMFRPDLRGTGWVGIVLAAIPLAPLIYLYLEWLNERYLITNRRVMEIRGIFNKHARDSALEKVNDVDLKQSIVGRLLGYGTLQIITGSDIGVNVLHRMSNPARFKRAMLNAKEQLHVAAPDMEDESYAVAGAPSPTVDVTAGQAAAPLPADIPDLIAELDELRQKGILSDKEFRDKKRELLSRM